VAPGATRTLNVTGTFWLVSEATHEFLLTANGGEEIPQNLGWKRRMNPGDYFSEIAIRNPSPTDELTVEIFFGTGELDDQRLNIVRQRYSPVITLENPTIFKTYTETTLAHGAALIVDATINGVPYLRKYAEIRAWHATADIPLEMWTLDEADEPSALIRTDDSGEFFRTECAERFALVNAHATATASITVHEVVFADPQLMTWGTGGGDQPGIPGGGPFSPVPNNTGTGGGGDPEPEPETAAHVAANYNDIGLAPRHEFQFTAANTFATSPIDEALPFAVWLTEGAGEWSCVILVDGEPDEDSLLTGLSAGDESAAAHTLALIPSGTHAVKARFFKGTLGSPTETVESAAVSITRQVCATVRLCSFENLEYTTLATLTWNQAGYYTDGASAPDEIRAYPDVAWQDWRASHWALVLGAEDPRANGYSLGPCGMFTNFPDNKYIMPPLS
jgi:hypothetical protein